MRIPDDLILSKRDLKKIDKKMASHNKAVNEIYIKRQLDKNRVLNKYWNINFGDSIDNIIVTEVAHFYKNNYILMGRNIDGKRVVIKNSLKKLLVDDGYKLI